MDFAEWFGFLLQMTVILLGQVEGDIKCICSTKACEREQEVTCTARHHCYVQYFAKTVDDVGHNVVRGCIDDIRPILCDNKRPTVLNDEWPVLHCCQSQYCNRDVIPTAPPWLVRASEDIKKNKSATFKSKEEKEKLDYARQLKYENNDLVLNPVYIGVPIAGGCVLLAIVLFAIFLLRRSNQRQFRRNMAANQKSSSEFKYNGHQNNNICKFDERSGNSESKLLMKV